MRAAEGGGEVPHPFFGVILRWHVDGSRLEWGVQWGDKAEAKKVAYVM